MAVCIGSPSPSPTDAAAPAGDRDRVRAAQEEEAGGGLGSAELRLVRPIVGRVRLRQIALLGALGALTWPAAAHGTFPGENGKIAIGFSTINPDGIASTTGDNQLFQVEGLFVP